MFKMKKNSWKLLSWTSCKTKYKDEQSVVKKKNSSRTWELGDYLAAAPHWAPVKW